MKKGLILGLVLLLSVSILAGCGGSAPAAGGGDGSLDRVKKAGELVVAIDATYPPMEFIDKDGKTPIGWDVEMAGEIAKKLGVKVRFEVMDWDGILGGLTGKRYDMVMSSMNITDERKQQVDFVEYVQMAQVFVSKKGVSVKAEKDLAGKKVVVQADTTSETWVTDAKKNTVKDIASINSFKAATDCFLELKNGRADVVVIDEPVGKYYAKLDPATYTVTGQAMKPEPVGIAIRKEDKDLKAAVEKAVKDLKSGSTFKSVSEKWFGSELGK